jgi:predicted aminopeptidase
MKRLLIVFAIFLAGCAKHVEFYHDPEFSSYIQEYERLFIVPTQYDVVFDNIEYQYNGLCSYFPQKVRINKTHWDQLDHCGREELIFHELTHCTFYIKHDTSLNNYGMPNSIMYPYLFYPAYYCANRDAYIQDIRNKISGN